jgi:mono/diheme cytochrome c family protein
MIRIVSLACVFFLASCSFEQQLDSKEVAELKGNEPAPQADKFGAFNEVIQTHCVSCHGSPDSNFGGVSDFFQKDEIFWQMSNLIEPGEPANSRLYQRIVKSHTGLEVDPSIPQNMPPNPDVSGFTMIDALHIKNYIESLDSNQTLSCEGIDTSPAPTEIRRYTKTELKHAVIDLLGGSRRIGELDKLPEDGTFDGFAEVGARQQVSQTFVEKYLEALQVIIRENIQSIDFYQSCDFQSKGVQACTEELLFEKARRAFSSELSNPQKQKLIGLVQTIIDHPSGAFTPLDGIAAGLEYILSSPFFLYEVVNQNNASNGIVNLSDYELAKRLAATLWKSVPDSTLLDVAQSGELQNPATLREQIQRMIDDQRFSRSRNTFLNQWLRLKRLDSVSPSPSIYGVSSEDFENIKPHLTEEVYQFVKIVQENDLPLRQMLNGQFSVLNPELAEYYGLQHPDGSGFKRVDFDDRVQRAGLSTLGAIVAMNSNTNRRSIVLSGVWFLNAMVCDDPPPPPNNVGQEIEDNLSSDATHKELARARANRVNCASCHVKIDAAGLAFNHIDSVGKRTDTDEFGRAVDSSGDFDGFQFGNTLEFLNYRPIEKSFYSCLATKYLIYSTGQSLLPKLNLSDRCRVQSITKKLETNSHLDSLITETLLSDFFTKRKISGFE